MLCKTEGCDGDLAPRRNVHISTRMEVIDRVKSELQRMEV